MEPHIFDLYLAITDDVRTKIGQYLVKLDSFNTVEHVLVYALNYFRNKQNQRETKITYC